MTEDRQSLRLRSLIFVALLLGGSQPESRAQVLGQKALPAQSVHRRRNDVKPEDPTRAIIAEFNKYEVVGMDAAHGNKGLDDLMLRLVRDPAFPNPVNDIVVECGNSLYQPILDRYIAGEDVPQSEFQRVWRDTSVSMCSVSGFYEILFPLCAGLTRRFPRQRGVAFWPATLHLIGVKSKTNPKSCLTATITSPQ